MAFVAGALRENVVAENVSFRYVPDVALFNDGDSVILQGKIFPVIAVGDGVEEKLELPYQFVLKDPSPSEQVLGAFISLTTGGILTLAYDATAFETIGSDSVTITAKLDGVETDYTIDYEDLTESTTLTVVSEGEGGLH